MKSSDKDLKNSTTFDVYVFISYNAIKSCIAILRRCLTILFKKILYCTSHMHFTPLPFTTMQKLSGSKAIVTSTTYPMLLPSLCTDQVHTLKMFACESTASLYNLLRTSCLLVPEPWRRQFHLRPLSQDILCPLQHAATSPLAASRHSQIHLPDMRQGIHH